jgi:glycyl-tRNA synthetase beta chain
MTDFLLELRSEEIPARMQAGARADLEKLFRKEMAAAGVACGDITVWSTPRRLALIARGLPLATAAVSEEVKGPKTSAPPQALEGFLRKTGLTQDQLVERDGVFFAITEKPGRETRAVLAEAIPAIVRAFPWPKSQRWGAASISTESLRWVRPLSGIVALLGDDLVDCEVGGIASGTATMGHRFHHPGEITIGSAADYQDKLRACHVIVDHQEREATVRAKAKAAAEAAGLVLVEDEGLVVENAGLTEWPVPLLGRFDAEYLEVPPEVIQLTARTNQKYFICRSPLPLAGGAGGGPVSDSAAPASDSPTPNPSRKREGDLANAFVCTANIVASDGGEAIVAGNRKVLAARLSDARFFWQQDRKKTLTQHAEGLARITFHEKLGTVADKVERVAKLARWLVEEGIVKPPHSGEDQASLADQAELAARLCKADLVTEMVGEFPELQGLMGGYYARAEGLPDAVADAIRDHYKPVGQGDDVPTAPVTVAVSLADKLDTLVGFLATGMFPTGSRDPYALRRAALALLNLDAANGLNISWGHAVMTAYIDLASSLVKQAYDPEMHVNLLNELRDFEGRTREGLTFEQEVKLVAKASPDATKIIDFRSIVPLFSAFMAERLEAQQKSNGVRHDIIDSVFTLSGEVRFGSLLARVHALQAFVATPDGTNLLAGYKRAANILKKEGFSSPLPFRGGAGGGACPDETALSNMPHPNPSPEGEGLSAYAPEPAEAALSAALAEAGPKAAAAVAAEDFAGAMAALAGLRGPIDAFFDQVTVNDADANKRAARLGLLAQFRDAVQHVADFSRIEG